MDPIERQLDLQRRAFGVDPHTLEGDARARFVRDNVIAATEELHELMRCYQWKPWAPEGKRGGFAAAEECDYGTSYYDEDDVLDEAVDVFHFLLNLVNVSRHTWPEFLAAYESKVAENFRRVEQGERGLMR